MRYEFFAFIRVYTSPEELNSEILPDPIVFQDWLAMNNKNIDKEDEVPVFGEINHFCTITLIEFLYLSI